MNNQQFRRIVLDTPARQHQQNDGSLPNASNGSATPAFASKSRPSILMTPRNVRGSVENNFARQLAERNGTQAQVHKKMFRASAAPKGTKLAAGYTDRTQNRIDDEADEKGRRIKALEEQLKLEQIDRAMFEELRDQITGGDVSATHLIKGLDRKLLERVRRGEDVMAESITPLKEAPKDALEPTAANDDDEALDVLESAYIAPVVREKIVKRGEMAAPPSPVAGGKRKRDAILADLKAQRKAAAEAAAAARPQLGSHFRRIDNGPRVEIDEKGREILIMVDDDGKVKRKVRKAKVIDNLAVERSELLAVDEASKPLGIEESELPKAAPPPVLDDDDDDIFEGVGADYDPLADIANDNDSENDAADPQTEEGEVTEPRVEGFNKPPTDREAELGKPTKLRNYFDDTTTNENIFDKPDTEALLATLTKASRIAEKSEANDESNIDSGSRDDEERLKRRAAMLATRDRDMDDIDMGFGASRDDDAADAEGEERIKLSQWKGSAVNDEDKDDEKGRGGKKRNRGSKKKKGDKDSAADVLKVMERNKAG